MKTIYLKLLLLFFLSGVSIPSAHFSFSNVVQAQQTTVTQTPSQVQEVKQTGQVVAKDAVVAKAEVKKADDKAEKPLPANAAFLFWSQLALLLVVIYFGIKYGGVSLGLLGGLGVTLLVFLYGAEPGKPPVEVMLIILAVVTTSSTLEATGALNLIVKFAEKLLRKNPQYIVFL